MHSSRDGRNREPVLSSFLSLPSSLWGFILLCIYPGAFPLAQALFTDAEPGLARERLALYINLSLRDHFKRAG